MNSFLYLLDTTVISEMTKQAPDENVIRLLMKNQKLSAIPSIVWGECLYGLKRMPDSKRKDTITDFYVNSILESYEFIPFDDHAAVIYSDIKSRLDAIGKPASELDMQIASTAIANNAVLVTRNTKDFQYIEQISALMLENWFKESHFKSR